MLTTSMQSTNKILIHWLCLSAAVPPLFIWHSKHIHWCLVYTYLAKVQTINAVYRWVRACVRVYWMTSDSCCCCYHLILIVVVRSCCFFLYFFFDDSIKIIRRRSSYKLEWRKKPVTKTPFLSFRFVYFSCHLSIRFLHKDLSKFGFKNYTFDLECKRGREGERKETPRSEVKIVLIRKSLLSKQQRT